MDFREQYLRAMREQAPAMHRSLMQRGDMEGHLDALDHEAAVMLDALLFGEPKDAEGLPLDKMQLATARELVFLGLTHFDDPGAGAPADAANRGEERSPGNFGEPIDLGRPADAPAPAARNTADASRPKLSDRVLRPLSIALWIAAGVVPLLVVGAAWLFPGGSAEIVVGLYDPVTDLAVLTLKVCIVVFVPTALVPATRGFARLGLWASAWVFGVALWLTSYCGAYQIWHRTAATVGVLVGIVGVEPEALVAALQKPDRMGAISLIVLASAWLGASALERQVVKWRSASAAAKSGDTEPAEKPKDPALIAGTAALYLGLFSAFTALPFAGWVTHIVECVADRRWNYLITGIFAFPIGVIHGWALWFGWFR